MAVYLIAWTRNQRNYITMVFLKGKSRWNNFIFPTGFSSVMKWGEALTFHNGMAITTRRVFRHEALLTS